MSNYNGMFNKDDINKKDMKEVGISIENFLEELDSVMVIPDDMKKEYEPKIEKARDTVIKLIKKLKHGDMSIFKDD